ncbi:hypothetical protein [Roseimaritima multifibrata]|uniref:hypothetical protein n=1 Tax=Roseimaritima multifibrata TaxID=1930274 RepID=UPI0011AADF1B|nr:hypothetical protein [Roseimaritima multifibrata]
MASESSTEQKGHRRDFTPAKVPTPEEIAERAAAIRATWTESERARRWCGGSRVSYAAPVAVPVVDTDTDDCD